MKTLFAISIVALLALLWAAFSIARHVRDTRRRRKALAAEKARTHRPSPPPIPYANPAVRADWAYFNKDLGDLTDPYQGPRTRPETAARDEHAR